MRRCRTRIALLALCLTVPAARADADQIKADEATLRQANVKPDGASLIELFRTLTPGEEELEPPRKLSHGRGRMATCRC